MSQFTRKHSSSMSEEAASKGHDEPKRQRGSEYVSSAVVHAGLNVAAALMVGAGYMSYLVLRPYLSALFWACALSVPLHAWKSKLAAKLTRLARHKRNTRHLCSIDPRVLLKSLANAAFGPLFKHSVKACQKAFYGSRLIQCPSCQQENSDAVPTSTLANMPDTVRNAFLTLHRRVSSAESTQTGQKSDSNSPCDAQNDSDLIKASYTAKKFLLGTMRLAFWFSVWPRQRQLQVLLTSTIIGLVFILAVLSSKNTKCSCIKDKSRSGEPLKKSNSIPYWVNVTATAAIVLGGGTIAFAFLCYVAVRIAEEASYGIDLGLSALRENVPRTVLNQNYPDWSWVKERLSNAAVNSSDTVAANSSSVSKLTALYEDYLAGKLSSTRFMSVVSDSELIHEIAAEARRVSSSAPAMLSTARNALVYGVWAALGTTASFLYAVIDVVSAALVFAGTLWALVSDPEPVVMKSCAAILNLVDATGKLQRGVEKRVAAIIAYPAKLAVFHALFTWTLMSFFGAPGPYLAAAAAWIFAIAPILPHFVVILPGALWMAITAKRIFAACFVFFTHVGISWYADIIFLAEIPGGNMMFTGPAYVLGLWAFGPKGLLVGPLLASTMPEFIDFALAKLNQH